MGAACFACSYMAHGTDVTRLRRKLWSSAPVACELWDKPAVASWMDGWHGWGAGSYGALLNVPAVRDLLEKKRPVVCDFGCGPGLLVERLQPRCGRVVGLDVAKSMVDVVEGKRRARGWSNVEARCVDVARCDVEELRALGPFDLVVSVTVLSFVARRGGAAAAAVDALRRCMAPGGLFVHFDWPDGDCGSRAGANRLYAAAGLEPVHAGHATIDGGGVFVGVARNSGAG
ncbi:Tellurite resistance protein TehB [Aureococcus anophagefferens]|uniref:Uncharacterized protein n=2 Tax=Aureococcus anophagefferens TaxID=44056 RepID=F0YBI1_AURAN|nr:hypothetical protein AURANDRAFT_64794 [Aureococcus anophagefferens]EGB07670.1 hypothetical protein AURANDRAFT_64794 [Aureococcus anophagefferens]|eukprot:XP_009037665.1 hypothetical protein AURANDRAFT_64794 [Aureococcus anophagefferens]